MDWLVWAGVAAAMFMAGLFTGRKRAAKRFAAGAPNGREVDRLALAEAWQRGFDAATLDASSARVAQEETVADFVADAAHAAPPAAMEGEPGISAASPESAPHPVGFQAGPIPGPVHPAQAPAALPDAPHLPAAEPVIPVDPRKRALRNINITLYVAALLMVAASSLFIALALPAAAKVVGLGIVAAGFYVVGLLMHARNERLRPAAAAFTSTGLALIPMTGLAHYLLLSSTPGASWFATSVVGTAAFVFAAGRLQSKVLAGLGITFLVSTAYSGGAVLNRGLIFYFLFSMLLAACILLVGLKRPQWISNIHLASFTAAHRHLVPATLAAALCSAAVLEALEYGWLFGAAALYYGVAVATGARTERFGHLLGLRAAVPVAIAGFLVAGEVPAAGIWRTMAALLLVQVVLLARFTATYRRFTGLGRGAVHSETWILLVLAAACTMLGAEGLLSGIWSGGKDLGLDVNWALALLLGTGIYVGARFGGEFRWVPLGAAILGFAEPMAPHAGRQGIVLAAAVLATWWLGRRAGGRAQLVLHWAARTASVPAIGALFSWAATGGVMAPWSGQRPVVVAGAEPLMDRSIEVASWIGVVLALLLQLALAVRNLRRIVRGTGQSSESRFAMAGEAVVFAMAVILAGAGSWIVSELLARGSGWQDLKVREADLGWSAVLWLGNPWHLVLAWTLLGAGLLGATMVLGHRRMVDGGAGSIAPAQSNLQLVEVHAGGLLALAAGLGLLAGHNPSWMVEIAALVSLAYAGIRILAAPGTSVRVGYALLAQLLYSGTAWHIADRLSMDAHGQYGLFAFTIASAQAARAYISRDAAARRPADPRSLMTLAAVAVLLLIPVAYLGSGFRDLDQAALLIQSLCLLGLSALVAVTRAHKEKGFAYVAIPAALGLLGVVLVPASGVALRHGGWLPEPLWSNDAAFGILAVLVIGALVAEWRTWGGYEFRWVRPAVALLYTLALFGLHDATEPGWQVAAGLLGAAGLLVFSASRGIPLLLTGTAVLVLFASMRGAEFIHQLAGQRGSEPLDTMLAFGATWVVLLLAAIFGDRFGGEGVPFPAVLRRTAGWGAAHGRVLFTASLAALGFGGLIGLAATPERLVYAGAAMLLAAVVAAAALEVPRHHRETGYESAALVGAAVIQRCWWAAVGATGAFSALYYWVLVLGALAIYEFVRKRGRRGTVVLGSAAGLLSFLGLLSFMSSTLAQQLLVLLAFTALLVFGVVANRRIFTVWGAVGVGVAVLWFLRGYTFLLLLLMAAGLIALAMWQLGRMNRPAEGPGLPQLGQPPSGPADPGPGEDPNAGAEPGQHPPAGTTPFGATGQPGPARRAGMPWMGAASGDGGARE